MNKSITYCYVDGHGNEQIGDMKEVLEGEQIGYTIEDELTARIWMSADTGQETLIIPLTRLVFIREVYSLTNS